MHDLTLLDPVPAGALTVAEIDATIAFAENEKAASTRRAYASDWRGELSAAVELRRRFPGITDNALARECARTIAGWKPRPLKQLPKRPRVRRMGDGLTD
jgi:hypothetical protein